MSKASQSNPFSRRDYKSRDYTQRIKISGTWAAWVSTFKNQCVRIMAREEVIGEGPNILLYWPSRSNKQNFAVDLSALTVAELDALEELMMGTFKLARPVCELRDRRARERLEAGDDSDRRNYSIFPDVVNRPWADGIDPESILERLAHDAPGDAGKRSADLRPGDGRSDLAQSYTDDQVSEDNSPEDDFATSVRPLDRSGHFGGLLTSETHEGPASSDS